MTHNHADTEREGSDRDGPLVSVVIPTYDRPSYLREAVGSVLDQTYDNVELIVVDDCSEVPARETVVGTDRWEFVDVQFVRHDRNRGPTAARNTGISAASGEFIAFLDDDDRWLPTKLDRQVEAISGDDDAGLVYTGVEKVRNDGTNTTVRARHTEDLTKELLCRNVVGTLSAVLVRADLAKEIPCDEQFPSWNDLAWYIDLSRETTFAPVPEPLVEYSVTSPDRLSEDVDKLAVSHDRFVEKYDPLAAEYGRLFRRKMHGWAAFRAGVTALHCGQYPAARRFLGSAVRWYPFEPRFTQHLLAATGGRPTHRTARGVKRAIEKVVPDVGAGHTDTGGRR